MRAPSSMRSAVVWVDQVLLLLGRVSTEPERQKLELRKLAHQVVDEVVKLRTITGKRIPARAFGLLLRALSAQVLQGSPHGLRHFRQSEVSPAGRFLLHLIAELNQRGSRDLAVQALFTPGRFRMTDWLISFSASILSQVFDRELWLLAVRTARIRFGPIVAERLARSHFSREMRTDLLAVAQGETTQAEGVSHA